MNALRGWEIFNMALDHNSIAISRSERRLPHSYEEPDKADLLGSGSSASVIMVWAETSKV